ncbi:cytochrome P450, partial [Haliangium sp. UPWRP_2]|uniref:cytochrome P450 n=1 Tax=Haliangium sp. UPWRP_2 TaxID=1931276 RepID=UPI001304AF52
MSVTQTRDPSPQGLVLPPLLRKNVSTLPLLGHALSLKQKPLQLLHEGRRQFGEVFGLNLAGQMTAVLSGPRANEAFFRAPDDQFSAKEAYQMMVPVFGKGVVYDSPPAVMDEQLGFVFPALKDSRLRTYCTYFHEECERYFASWGNEGTADIYTTTNELTVFIASRCLLSRDFRNNLSAHFAKLYHDLQGGINLIAFFAPQLPLPAFRRRDKARAEIVRLCSQITAERRRTGVVEEDFIQTLMSARYKHDDRPLTDDEITGLILALLFGGQHTSAVMSAWAVIELLQHPYLLPPLLEEQQSVMSGKSALAMDNIRAMVRLERLLNET